MRLCCENMGINVKMQKMGTNTAALGVAYPRQPRAEGASVLSTRTLLGPIFVADGAGSFAITLVRDPDFPTVLACTLAFFVTPPPSPAPLSGGDTFGSPTSLRLSRPSPFSFSPTAFAPRAPGASATRPLPFSCAVKRALLGSRENTRPGTSTDACACASGLSGGDSDTPSSSASVICRTGGTSGNSASTRAGPPASASSSASSAIDVSAVSALLKSPSVGVAGELLSMRMRLSGLGLAGE